VKVWSGPARIEIEITPGGTGAGTTEDRIVRLLGRQVYLLTRILEVLESRLPRAVGSVRWSVGEPRMEGRKDA
jgi:hypothetical protein